MTTVVINKQYGGFDLSEAGLRMYLANCKNYPKNYELGGWHPRDIPRTDATLVEVVAALGEKASGPYSNLVLVEVPSDVNWHIKEYDGWEHIAEDHRTWGR